MNLNEQIIGRPDYYRDPQAKAVYIEGNQPLSVRLKEKLLYHKEQIIKIEATLKLLETNQDFEKLLFLINEVH